MVYVAKKKKESVTGADSEEAADKIEQSSTGKSLEDNSQTNKDDDLSSLEDGLGSNKHLEHELGLLESSESGLKEGEESSNGEEDRREMGKTDKGKSPVKGGYEEG